MAYQHLPGTEGVTVRASRRWLDDPLPGRGWYELAQHVSEKRGDWEVVTEGWCAAYISIALPLRSTAVSISSSESISDAVRDDLNSLGRGNMPCH